MAFEMFGPAHIAGIIFTVAVFAVIVAFRSAFSGPRADRMVRYGLAALLGGSDLALYAWYTATDNWGWQALPFQLCTMTLWISVAMLLTGSRRLYEIAFFLGILGALQAIATPYLDVSFPNFRYFHFFLAHAAIIAASVYMTAARGYRPTFRSLLRAWMWLNLLAVPASIANALTGENYMFLARKPDTASMLDLLAPWPWYILQLEAIAVILCLALLGIVALCDRLAGRRKSGRKSNLLPNGG